MNRLRQGLFVAIVGLIVVTPAMADSCSIPKTTIEKLQATLATVAQSGNGGIFTPNRMWSAVVDRKGVLCSVINNNADAWPGSRAIAMAKAYTANAFSATGL